MKKINDGGPAFSTIEINRIYTETSGELFVTESTGGMSLRAYFAGQALSAMIISDPRIGYRIAANYAIGHADALIHELEKGGADEEET